MSILRRPIYKITLNASDNMQTEEYTQVEIVSVSDHPAVSAAFAPQMNTPLISKEAKAVANEQIRESHDP